MKIVIVTALPPEFNVARNELGLKEITNKKDRPRIAEGRDITLVLTGMGRDMAYDNLKVVLENREAHIIIDSGTCGSLVDYLNIGDIVYSREILDISESLEVQGRVKNIESPIENIIENFTGREFVLASVDKNITEEGQRESLKQLGAQVVAWETIGIMNIAKEYGTPALSIRGVTDSCNGETYKDFRGNSLEVCKKLYNSVKILCKGI